MIRSAARALCAPLLLGAALLAAPAALAAEPVKPATKEGDVMVKDFTFKTGEILPEVRLHYTTLGAPHRDAKGHVDNAILIMHGTGGTGAQFLRPQFSDVLFQPGGVLDPARYYIILPDDVGHGKSSKPSDGLHAHFPRYDYDDMVALEHQLVTRLGVDHLRLVMGTSMGCMHAFVWGETYPDAMDALMPLACLPQTIAGRNRLWRQMSIAAIKADPAWQGGEYKAQPKEGLRTAAALLSIAGSAPIQMQKTYPTREAADAAVEKILDVSGMEANDLIYQLDASRFYDPSPKLETIKAPVLWINSGDDFINPPELGLAEQLAKRIPKGQFILIPASDQTHGHGSHTWAVLWQDKLADLLARTAAKN
ncbi:homoserine O-acetyltransferase [Nitrospirillum amazonense]|uniref:Homoserine O-acetyltransferase n=1 Tax=Nitrospirillum amazonense TaxID=28077 RepID=A0A560FG88_9PROT|nr:alpha/beta fold hydrolase [Nitrospirillum amazonense]TWB20621.1 homoserine O-acetyltransferase [Nitrospirillum amazonense]